MVKFCRMVALEDWTFPPWLTHHLEPESEAGVRQQVDAALHDVFSNIEVWWELCLHVRSIISFLTLCRRRHLWKDS